MHLPNIYATPYYKFYVIISIALAIAAFLALPGLKYGIDLNGGTQLMATIDSSVSEAELGASLAKYSLDDLSIRFSENPLTGRKGVIIEFAGTPDLIEADAITESNPGRAIALARPYTRGNASAAMTAREVVELAKADFTKEVQNGLASFLGVPEEQIGSVEIGASLGREFWETSQRALLVAFFLIAAIVFIIFREVVPSIAVIQAAVFDVFIALGGMAVFGIPLTLPTIAALLMMLGHSVDTDILITDRILKRKQGTPAERAFGAMKTGVTMTGTLLIVLVVLVVFSHFNQMTTLFQIAAVLMFGMLADLPSTYFTNSVLVQWWAERKQK
ncbi:MAG: hypothetical protein KAW41_02095 [Candidatus Diapherotrites archaeon]|nr:hypothetical protein [Candidatus Diapherotrites archaeon]